jgi:hypothetical protein
MVIARFSAIVSPFLLEYVPVSGIFVCSMTKLPTRLTGNLVAARLVSGPQLVLVSHGHYDHLDVRTLSRLAATHRARVITVELLFMTLIVELTGLFILREPRWHLP